MIKLRYQCAVIRKIELILNLMLSNAIFGRHLNADQIGDHEKPEKKFGNLYTFICTERVKRGADDKYESSCT